MVESRDDAEGRDLARGPDRPGASLGDVFRDLAAVAARVLADKDAMRQLTAHRVSSGSPDIEDDPDGTLRLVLSERDLDEVVDRARGAPERRFRMESMLALRGLVEAERPGQRERAEAVIEELATDPDELVASMARYLLENPPAAEDREALVGGYR